MQEIIGYTHGQLIENYSMEDSIELLRLALALLGDNSNFTMSAPGAYLKARWMDASSTARSSFAMLSSSLCMVKEKKGLLHVSLFVDLYHQYSTSAKWQLTHLGMMFNS